MNDRVRRLLMVCLRSSRDAHYGDPSDIPEAPPSTAASGLRREHTKTKGAITRVSRTAPLRLAPACRARPKNCSARISRLPRARSRTRCRSGSAASPAITASEPKPSTNHRSTVYPEPGAADGCAPATALVALLQEEGLPKGRGRGRPSSTRGFSIRRWTRGRPGWNHGYVAPQGAAPEGRQRNSGAPSLAELLEAVDWVDEARRFRGEHLWELAELLDPS